MVLKIGLSKITLSWALYLIISSLFMRQVLNYILNKFQVSGLTVMLWVVFVFGVIIAWLYLYRLRPAICKRLIFLGIMAAGLFYVSQIEIVEERMHLINFSLLGWLAARDIVKIRKGIQGIGFSLLFCIFVAMIEEAFQWWLPYRTGEIHDIMLAGIGGAWGISLSLINSGV